MDFRTFQCLLSAGFRLRAREQMMAMNAASFPHMDEKGRRQAANMLERQAESAEKEDAGTTGGDLAGLRAYVHLDALRHPMRPRGTMNAPEAARGAESESDGVG